MGTQPQGFPERVVEPAGPMEPATIRAAVADGWTDTGVQPLSAVLQQIRPQLLAGTDRERVLAHQRDADVLLEAPVLLHDVGRLAGELAWTALTGDHQVAEWSPQP